MNCSGDNESLAARPEPALLSVQCGETAQNVMERAVRQDPSFTFTATYIGGSVGYRIDAINGTGNFGECFWFFFYQEPGNEEATLQVQSVTDFVIPQNGSAVILRYRTEPEPPTTPPVMTTNGASRLNAVSLLLTLSVAVAYYFVR